MLILLLKLILNIKSSVVTMKGFGGAYSTSLGTSHVDVHVDDIALSGFVELTKYKIADIGFITGQSIINEPYISLIISQNYVKFKYTSDTINSILSDIKLHVTDFITKFPVWLRYNCVF